MKTNSTSVRKATFAFIVSSLISICSFAQCTAPSLSFSSPVLYSGTAGQENAVYKFSNVSSGIDAYITILSIVGGAKLDAIDDTTTGYYRAWQPVVDGPNTPTGTTSYIKWRVDFKTSSTSAAKVFTCLTLSAIDIDGDGAKIREFIQAFGISGYYTQSPTSLTVTNAGDSVKALGPLATSAGIDTSAWKTNININFNAISSITLETGAYVDNGHGGTSTDRYNCIYFQQIGTDGSFGTVLPVDFISFNGSANNNQVLLNWETSTDINSNHFEVEQSFDNSNFKTVGFVLDGFDADGGNKSYQYKDNSAELQQNDVVYYRIKQVDENGTVTYSKVLAVKLGTASKNEMSIQVYPNPVAAQMNIQFNSNESGNAVVKLISIAGQTVVSKQTIIGKGFNMLQVLDLGGIPKGMYIAQLSVNGTVIGNQKVVKN